MHDKLCCWKIHFERFEHTNIQGLQNMGRMSRKAQEMNIIFTGYMWPMAIWRSKSVLVGGILSMKNWNQSRYRSLFIQPLTLTVNIVFGTAPSIVFKDLFSVGKTILGGGAIRIQMQTHVRMVLPFPWSKHIDIVLTKLCYCFACFVHNTDSCLVSIENLATRLCLT